MKIVILEGHAVNPGDLSWDQFKQFGEVVVYERTNRDEVVERTKDADCILSNKTVFRLCLLLSLLAA